PLPLPGTLDNYRTALGQFPIWRLLLNTLITSAAVTALQLIAAIPAAYALVMFRFRGRGLVDAAIVGALLVPPQSLIIPQFLAISHLGWRDSYLGVVVPQLSTCALAVVLVRDHVRSMPSSLIGAATLDGATPWETLRYVVLPLLRPTLGAVAVIVFINSWNEYLWPTLAAPSTENTTIQPGLALFLNQEGPVYGPLLAAAMLATLPVVAVYLVASRRIADAFLHSGLR